MYSFWRKKLLLFFFFFTKLYKSAVICLADKKKKKKWSMNKTIIKDLLDTYFFFVFLYQNYLSHYYWYCFWYVQIKFQCSYSINHKFLSIIPFLMKAKFLLAKFFSVLKDYKYQIIYAAKNKFTFTSQLYIFFFF